jgi:hypothetical protein
MSDARAKAHRGEDGADRRHVRRDRVLSQAKILLGVEQIYCAVHDLSAVGAKPEVWSGARLPAHFDLLLVEKQVKLRAQLRWRKGEFAGVSFGPA